MIVSFYSRLRPETAEGRPLQKSVSVLSERLTETTGRAFVSFLMVDDITSDFVLRSFGGCSDFY